MKTKQIRYDWATGDRWWGDDHVHRRFANEPISYTGGIEWGTKRSRKVKRVACRTPGCPILRWADEPNEISREESAARSHTSASAATTATPKASQP